MTTRHLVAVIVGLALTGGAASAQDEPTQPPTGSPAGDQPAPQAASPSPDQTPEQGDLPSPESLFERHIEAIGGWDAIRAITNRHIKGRIRNEKQGFLARLELWAEMPNKERVLVQVPGQGELDTWYDGQVGWRVRGDEYQLVTGDSLVDLSMTADFLGEADYAVRYAELKTIDRRDFKEGREVYRVAYKAKNGKQGIILFDTESGLIDGSLTTMTLKTRDVSGQMQSILVLEDYKDFGGMLWPTKIRQVTPNGETVITYRTVEVNVDDMPDFTRPAEVDKLVAEEAEKAEQGPEPEPEAEPDSDG